MHDNIKIVMMQVNVTCSFRGDSPCLVTKSVSQDFPAREVSKAPHLFKRFMLWRDICPYVPQITWVASNNQHYRHTSIDTTYRLYIAKNNIMKTQRFEARMRANGNGNGGGHTIGNGWVAVPAFSPQAAPQPAPMAEPAVGPDVYITEDEAIRRTRGLGLNYRSLRAHGVEAGQGPEAWAGIRVPVAVHRRLVEQLPDHAGGHGLAQDA